MRVAGGAGNPPPVDPDIELVGSFSELALARTHKPRRAHDNDAPQHNGTFARHAQGRRSLGETFVGGFMPTPALALATPPPVRTPLHLITHID